jgi:epoxyqueuosine reductase QueG
MEQAITELIMGFAKEHDKVGLIPNIWRTPLVRFGDANHPEMERLRELVHPEHVLPNEVLPGAKVVIAYFFPFTEEIGDSNKKDRLSSKEWAMAYEKTNAAFGELNQVLISFLKEKGHQAAVTPEAFRYDESILKSRWSQRHIARLCGLGTFGMNNMLITEAGCCGRIGTVVTDLDVEPSVPIGSEYCLFKRDGSCEACIERCPSKALTKEGYKRFACNSLCEENAKVHIGYGSSYTVENADQDMTGSYTCGKCVVGVPCTFRRP